MGWAGAGDVLFQPAIPHSKNITIPLLKINVALLQHMVLDYLLIKSCFRVGKEFGHLYNKLIKTE